MSALFRLHRAVFSQISKRYVAHLAVDLGSETTLNKSIYGLSRIPSTSFHSSSCMFNVLAIKVPAFPESITEGDVNWKKSIGDNVLADEIIAEIETDKTTLPVMSPCSGIITEFLVEDGSRVIYNQEIGKVDEQEVSAKKPEIKEPIKHSVVPEQPKATVVKTLPSTPAESQKTTSQPPPIVNLPEVTQKPFRSEQRVKLTRIRLRTAERLKGAQNTCAILTTFQEVDMSNLVELRNQFKDAFFKKHGIKLGLMSTFGKASAYALKDQPILNAYIDEGDVVYRHYVDISIAVASPKGLVVPVLRNVEGMNFAQIERGIFELGEKAKSGSLAVEDMDGGTFTISNGGIFGSLLSTPIVNPPQSAILGLHGTFDRPVARNGQVVIRPMMYIALSYDHRLIDGREAVLFLRKIKSFVEDPRVFFLDI